LLETNVRFFGLSKLPYNPSPVHAPPKAIDFSLKVCYISKKKAWDSDTARIAPRAKDVNFDEGAYRVGI
jgi:hypothetical protein